MVDMPIAHNSRRIHIMIVLLLIVITAAFALPYPLNMIQCMVGSLFLGSKLTMLLGPSDKG